ncbi:MAG: hypothetical protein V2J07_05170 [Anaerolineae bacterium]|nr:hypothetical protein [Anaerolineae bacterium]
MEQLLEKLLPLLPSQEHHKLLAELEKPLRPALRINPLKQKPEESFPNDLSHRYHWEFSPISYCPEGFWQEKENEISLGQTWEHRLGRYYVQDASSMLPVELFHLSDIEKPLILDMAASPGGKTTHLISKTRDKGLVIANDASRDRIQALRIVLQNWGGLRQAITQFQGERFGEWFPNTFDAILLDAPCSMQNLRPTEARPMRPISDREERTLAKRQYKLLESALFAARPGGQIVYATCTLSPEEDEMVLDWLIKKYARSVHVEDLSKKMGLQAPGLQTYRQQEFNPDIQNAFRLWPHLVSSSGFFCVRLTKLDEMQGKTKIPPTFSIEKTDFQPVDSKMSQELETFFQQFQVDLRTQYLQKGFSLWQRKDVVFLFPDRYFQIMGYLPLRSLGLPIANSILDTYLPDHFFLARCFYENELPSTIIEEEWEAPWQAGNAIPAPISDGELHLLHNVHGEFLGISKRTNDEFKNLLPRRMIL